MTKTNNSILKPKALYIGLLLLLFAASCGNKRTNNESPVNKSDKQHYPAAKPPSVFSDTLKINSQVAVFYYPDSIQFKKIKAGMDTMIFDAMIHEYTYQVKYVHTILSKNWPLVNVLEADNVRYILFIKSDKSKEIIDLDTKYDPYGVFIFDPRKSPTQLDMTNAESQIGFYFNDTLRHSDSK